MASRLETVFNHIKGSGFAVATSPSAALPYFRESDEDVVIVSALRTPIGKAKRGSFKVT